MDMICNQVFSKYNDISVTSFGSSHDVNWLQFSDGNKNVYAGLRGGMINPMFVIVDAIESGAGKTERKTWLDAYKDIISRLGR